MATTSTTPLTLSANFILPEDERPQLSQVSSLASIPIIDLDDPDTNNVVQKISQACEEYGFFQVINHGVPKELCDKVMTAVTSFFELPPEEKAEFYTADQTKLVKLFNYYQKVEEGREKVNMWSQSFSHHWHHQDDGFTHQLPKNPPQYRELFAEYAKEIGPLMTRLLSLISQGLGLDRDCLQKKLAENPFLRTQSNYYPPCPNPELTLGQSIHTDFRAALNVLMQSEGVSGLQVLKDGQWIAVDPLPNVFVINLGDQLQVLSNDRYKSVYHRAVTNKTQKRISIAMFYGPNEDAVVGPIEELIDEEHPPLYSNYHFSEFLEEFYKHEGATLRVKEVFKLPN